MATTAKRPKTDDGADGKMLIFYAPQKLFSRQIEGMRRAISIFGCDTTDSFSPEVTHIVTGLTFEEDVWSQLKQNPLPHINVVSPKWHADSIRKKQLLPIESYRLKPKKNQEKAELQDMDKDDVKSAYACQRSTPLKHHNVKFTEALEVLAQEADLRGGDNNYSRSLAFRRCSSVLKSLPFMVDNIHQVKNKKDVGQHCLRIIKDIIETGFSSEVDSVLESEWFSTMKIFTSVFGVGRATAEDWFSQGFRSIEDVIKNKQTTVSNDTMLSIGLAYYEDLSMHVSLNEAEHWQKYIYSELKSMESAVQVDITGGFRRGKAFGHDIDLLISHPRNGIEVGLLPKLLERLVMKNLVLYGRYEKPSFTEDRLKDDTKHTPLKSSMDHFEKWIGVVKMSRGLLAKGNEASHKNQDRIYEFIPHSLSKLGHTATDGVVRNLGKNADDTHSMVNTDRDWVARRVDLIVTPGNQYYFALVGWTGSKEFNRSLRWYAQKELNYKLTSHGLWDFNEGKSIPAESEKDVFDKLNLPYYKPQERNC